MTVQEKATEYRAMFETAKRDDGSQYWRAKEQQLRELCYAAHGDMLSDDERYRFIVDALDILAEYGIADDGSDDDALDSIEADIMTADLTDWLSSSVTRASYVDDAVSHYGWTDTVHALQQGQYEERREVYSLVRNYIEDELGENNDD